MTQPERFHLALDKHSMSNDRKIMKYFF